MVCVSVHIGTGAFISIQMNRFPQAMFILLCFVYSFLHSSPDLPVLPPYLYAGSTPSSPFSTCMPHSGGGNENNVK